MNSSYSEQHHFGYRWYDQNMVKPAYEFGFGLSYTKFEYSLLKVTDKSLSFRVMNIGKVDASEIAQVYLSVPETENFTGGYRSPKALKHFAKVPLKAGTSQVLSFKMADRDFSYWSVKDQKWIVEPGTYKVLIGASSRDIRLAGYITIN